MTKRLLATAAASLIASVAFQTTLTALSPALAFQQPPTVEAERTATYGSRDRYTSEIEMTDLSFGGERYLGAFINAPLQAVEAIYVARKPEDIFPKVTGGNAEWSLQIEKVTWDHSNSDQDGELGMGSVRRCDFVGGAGAAYERVYHVEENRLFAYDLDSERSSVPLPIRDFFVVWTVEPKGRNGSLVVARMYYHEAQDMGGNAAKAIAGALKTDFKNFANIYDGTYLSM